MQLVTSGLEICLSGYAVIVAGSNVAELFKFIVYFSIILLQLVVWCWPGELLIQESTAISEVVYYELPWYLLTASQQRELMFMVIRAQKGCTITALGFQVMSLSKLTEVCY